MEYPPNTVPITVKELDHLIDNNIDCITYQSDTKFIGWWKPQTASKGLETRIKTHDYRHYFGEVVDLKEHYDNEFVRYFGYKFKVVNIDGVSCVKNCSGNTDFVVKRGSTAVSKRWVCNFYKALFKKDLPHLNIKFVWS